MYFLHILHKYINFKNQLLKGYIGFDGTQKYNNIIFIGFLYLIKNMYFLHKMRKN